MGKYDYLKTELKTLINVGTKLQEGLSLYTRKCVLTELPSDKYDKIVFFFENYEKWYTKSLAVIKVLLPDHYSDFSLLYRNDKRKELTWKTYTLSDAVQQITSSDNRLHPHDAATRLNQQVSIFSACLDRIDSKISDIQTLIQADLFDSEIDAARHLLKRGFLRAAGAVCGVIIEKHFASVCQNRSIVVKKSAPTIADYNDTLKDVVYDTIKWRQIQHLGDIRNLCDHSKDREPDKVEVEELINGTDKIIKTIF